MEIFPQRARRAVFGLRAPRVAMVGRLGALGSTGDITWTQDPSTGVYTVTDPATSYTVTVTAGSMDAGLSTGGVPTAITSDGGLLWSDPTAFAAYYGASTGIDITNPYSIPGYVPGWSGGGLPGGGTQMRPPGVTPLEDIAFDEGSGGDEPQAERPLTKEEYEKKEKELRSKVSPETLAEIDEAKKNGTLGEWIAKNPVKAGLAALALAILIYEYTCDATPGCVTPAACRDVNRSGPSPRNVLTCGFDIFFGRDSWAGETGSGGSTGTSSDPCSTDGVAKATADINAAKTTAQVDAVVTSVESSCGKESAAADLIRKTAKAKKTRMTVGSVALWGGLGLGVALILIVAARNRR